MRKTEKIMKDQKIKIEEEMKSIEIKIDSKKKEIKELRLRKYFLNQMIGKIDRLEKDYKNLLGSENEE